MTFSRSLQVLAVGLLGIVASNVAVAQGLGGRVTKLEEEVRKLNTAVESFSRTYVTRAEFGNAMVMQDGVNKAQADAIDALKDQVAINTEEIGKLRKEFATITGRIEKNVEILGRITQETPSGGIFLSQQVAEPIGTVTIFNRTRYPQRIYVNRREVLVAGYGQSTPVQVFPGNVVTQLANASEGPKNWHVGPGNNHRLNLWINP